MTDFYRYLSSNLEWLKIIKKINSNRIKIEQLKFSHNYGDIDLVKNKYAVNETREHLSRDTKYAEAHIKLYLLTQYTNLLICITEHTNVMIL